MTPKPKTDSYKRQPPKLVDEFATPGLRQQVWFYIQEGRARIVTDEPDGASALILTPGLLDQYIEKLIHLREML